MAIISMPGSSEFLIIGIILLYWCFIITTAIAIMKRKDLELTNRLLWLIVLLMAPVLGIFLYNLFGRPVSRA